eukprot:TRINITY_DN33822_c0_g1_i1.p1 TRINITY_DN33822_c0_g1~~TRINITY_DN33822_c0_g1_i1.p1  ORF type:complete len:1028 (-),score=165.69 TRINITY_DN33822_c0_g1_i1:15-3098(-)
MEDDDGRMRGRASTLTETELSTTKSLRRSSSGDSSIMTSQASFVRHMQTIQAAVTAQSQNNSTVHTYKATRCYNSMRFLARSGVQILHALLQVWTLVIFSHYMDRNCFLGQALVQAFSTVLSVAVVCFDADVRRYVRVGHCCRRLLYGLVAFLLLGVCHMIHIKRAWSRQVHVAAIVADLEEEDTPLRTGAALGPESVLPLALLAGVPSALISSYAFLTLEVQNLEAQILLCTTVVSIVIVACGVVDVDTSVSTYVTKRWHFDLARRGSRAGRFQCLFPFVHLGFRTVEVLSRVALLVVLFALMGSRRNKTLKLLAFFFFFVDYVIGILVLRRFSPREELLLVHGFVAVAMLLADIVRFVDMPGFCHPSRRIGRYMDSWRICETLALAILFAFDIQARRVDKDDSTFFKYQRRKLALYIFIGSTVLYYAMRLSPVFRSHRRGDDLHSAVANSRLERMRKLLDAGRGGEVLDVNGVTKDDLRATPAMLAAASGDVAALKMLFDAGAQVSPLDSARRTCLHHAVLHGQAEALQFILGQRGASKVVASFRRDLVLSLPRKLPLMSEQRRGEILEMLEGTRLHVESMLPGEGEIQSIRANCVSGLQLKTMFPDFVQDEVPSRHEVISVSGLILAYSFGPLARRVISTESSTSGMVGGFDFSQLRMTKVLGEGASGRVIEVEVEEKGSSHLSSTFTFTGLQSWVQPAGPTKRYALKLQKKAQADNDWRVCSEALALQRVVHPFIVRLESAFQTPQHFALVLELCNGGDLNKRLSTTMDDEGECNGLPEQESARLGGQILLALVFLHEEHGIVYRDLKPENVLLSGGDAKLADFGTAKYVGRTQRKKKMSLIGTKGFLAPELVFGDDDAVDDDEGDEKVNPFKTDAYSFGITLQLMLLGQRSALLLEDTEGHTWMMPRDSDEAENEELLRSLTASGELSTAALELLLMLVPFKPGRRSVLEDDSVRQHRFFLQALGCEDLAKHLLPVPPTTSSDRIIVGRMGSSITSVLSSSRSPAVGLSGYFNGRLDYSRMA